MMQVVGKLWHTCPKNSQLPGYSEWSTCPVFTDYLRSCHICNVRNPGAGASIPYWDFDGSTIVTGTYVRLTSDQPSRLGSLWNSIVSYLA